MTVTCDPNTELPTRFATPDDLLTLLGPPEIVGHSRDWVSYGACRSANNEWFFRQRAESIADALAVCETCPVVEWCLEYAIATNQQIGVWGGMSGRQRSTVRRRRMDRARRARKVSGG